MSQRVGGMLVVIEAASPEELRRFFGAGDKDADDE